ncbi:hypothetical protein PINS_up007661 [Pythium insidiosum]|nr:hypothetical protein PINS_up007661 [Pythium insidiosum]
MFEDQTQFFGVSETPMKAHGKTTVKIKLGATIVYEMELWVAEFEAHSFVILGTDFMLRAGLRVDLGSKECILPKEEPIPLLTYEQL